MRTYQNGYMLLGSEKYVPTVCFLFILIHPPSKEGSEITSRKDVQMSLLR